MLRLSGAAICNRGVALLLGPPTLFGQLIRAILVVTCFSCSAFGQTWTTGYFRAADGYGPSGGSLSGAPTNVVPAFQWHTTDPNEVNGMFWRSGWTLGLTTAGNKSALFGGYNAVYGGAYWPGVTNPVLYRDFTSPLQATSPVVVVSMDFGILPTASGEFANKDKFGFEFLRASDSFSLAEFVLNPATSTVTNGLRLEWMQNGTNVAGDGSTFQSFSIQYGGLYRFTASISGSSFDMSLFGLATQTNGSTVTNFTVTASNWVVKNGRLSGSSTAADFSRLALNWDLTSGNTNQPGGNYMNLNTVSVTTTVPEPSTFALAALAALAFAGLRLSRRT